MPLVFRSMLADDTGLIPRIANDADSLESDTLAMGGRVMTDFDSFDGSHEQAYAVALMQLNELIEAGRDEDADRDAVRDVMDMHWNRVETARGNGRATTRSICKCFRTVE